MKEKQRTFVATKNLYLYFDEEYWGDENPTEYGRDYGMTAKEVRDKLLQDTIYRGTKLTLVKNDDGGAHTECPYGLAKKNGYIAVYLEDLRDINLDWFEEVS